ncbi:MAG: nickel pincer cofactor biosynthesis protein LarC, partial [Tannerellaceae bacterium]|nr:nickel pincer cofactor biosynthesis protein LarC [Tannerellaceae bacterium]
DLNKLTGELNKLYLDGWEIRLSEVEKHSVGAKHIDVILHDETHTHTHKWFHRRHHTHSHRTMADIERIIGESGISESAKDLAIRIFYRLAVAEAKIHGSTPSEVHFHEVGAVDSIIDIVGTAICIDLLSPDKIYASVLHDGYGFVHCQHGTIPVPVPAVAEVLAARGTNVKQLDVEGELTTPTGAAILAELAESFGPMPEMKLLKTGYGAGTKNLPIPNLLRVMYGESHVQAADTTQETATVIETNIDDSTPEVLSYVMEKLFEAGAKDVFFTPIYMKKCRPATMLSIICDESQTEAMEHILFSETSTIGLRKYTTQRTCLPRKVTTLSTPFGDVKAKEIRYKDTCRYSIEYDDACRLAKEKNIPLQWVMDKGRQ